MDLKTRAIRIFGWLSLILGLYLAGSTVFLLSVSRTYHPWAFGSALIPALLLLLLAANLVYVGWYSLAHGAIPVRPRALFHEGDLLRFRERFFGRITIPPRVLMAMLFAGCGYLGARFAMSYNIHLRPGDNFPWFAWLVEFPMAMAVAFATALLLDWMPGVRAASLLTTLATLLMANMFAFVAFMFFGAFLWILAFIPALIVNAFFIALAQAIVSEETQRSLEMKWGVFFGRLLWAGTPIGVLIGALAGYSTGRADWVIPALQITWGAMLGISAVPAMPKPAPAQST